MYSVLAPSAPQAGSMMGSISAAPIAVVRTRVMASVLLRRSVGIQRARCDRRIFLKALFKVGHDLHHRAGHPAIGCQRCAEFLGGILREIEDLRHSEFDRGA